MIPTHIYRGYNQVSLCNEPRGWASPASEGSELCPVCYLRSYKDPSAGLARAVLGTYWNSVPKETRAKSWFP